MDQLISIQRYNPEAESCGVRRVPTRVRKVAHLPIGLPFLVDNQTGRIIEQSLAFSMSIADQPIRARTGRDRVATALTYHYPMRQLCEVARREVVSLRHVDDDLFGLWLAGRIDDASLKRKTIVDGLEATRLWTLHMNARFGFDIEVDFDSLKAKCWGLDSLYDIDGNRLDAGRADAGRAHMIRVIEPSAWQLIEAGSGPPACSWRRGGPSSRPRIAQAFGLEAGCRLVEVSDGIHLDDIMRITVTDPDRDYPLYLRRTKNVEGREVLVPGDLVREAQAYARGEREVCQAAARTLRGSSWEEPRTLLVNSLASGADVGAAVAPASLQRDFRVVQERSGLVRPAPAFGSDGSMAIVDRALHCFHDLRHTCARALFDVAIAMGADFERAVEIVQVRLGHARRSTTEQIYLFRDRRLARHAGDMIVSRVRDFVGRGSTHA